MAGRVAGKTTIVTGAASGIGRAAATLLAQEGAQVVLTDVNRKDGEAAANQIGHGAVFMPHDTTSEADWTRVLADTQAKFGAVHGLVNNAGIAGSFPATPETETLESWRKIQTVNVEGVFLGCKLGGAAIAASGGGSIVNISSLAALVGTPSLFAYGASKAAVRQLTKSVAMHAARRKWKVRCNSVHPGVIMTPMGEGLFLDGASKETYLKMIPVGEFGAPQDIGWCVVFLISDESRYATGSEFVIDGGIAAS
jgi:3(or 17)beta-hydroxysteroid dehydrogenase